MEKEEKDKLLRETAQGLSDTIKIVNDLKKEVAELTKKLNASSKLQDDFSSVQIVRREVKFLGKVRNANGAAVIN